MRPYVRKPLLEYGLVLSKKLRSAGTIMEFGVGVGRTFEYLAKNKRRPDVLIGFDAFQGLPAEAEGIWPPIREEVDPESLVILMRVIRQRLARVGG